MGHAIRSVPESTAATRRADERDGIGGDAPTGGSGRRRASPAQPGRIASPDELAARCSVAEITAISTSPSGESGLFWGIGLPSGGRIDLQRVAFDVAVSAGVDRLVLPVPLGDPSWGQVNGWPLRDGRTSRAIMPGGELFATVPAGTLLAVIGFDWASIERTADDLGVDLRDVEPVASVFDEDLSLRQVAHALGLGLGWPEADQAAADSELREVVVRALVGPGPSSDNPSRSFSIFADADSYAAAKGWRNVSISEVCRAIGTSESQLRRAFREVAGCSPKRYFTARALNAVHTALRESRPDETTVTETAAALGFWHFGRFAGDYRNLFGELPVETLRADAAA